MSWSNIRQSFHLLQKWLIDDSHAAEISCKDRFETNAADFIHRLQAAMLCIRQLFKADSHSGRMIRHDLFGLCFVTSDLHGTGALRILLPDAIDPTFGKLGLVRQIKQTILEAGRTKIGDKNFHETLP